MLAILKFLATLPSLLSKLISFLQSQKDLHAGEATQANADHAVVDTRVQQGQVVEDNVHQMTVDQLNAELGR